MNEAETRAELIDPKLRARGWETGGDIKIHREHPITAGKIQSGGQRATPLSADYVLEYKGRKLAVIEAKRDELEVGEGVAQAKQYAEMMHIDMTYSSNGKEIYQISMNTGQESLVENFPTPEELWNKAFDPQNHWQGLFDQLPYEDVGGTKSPRYYQEIAVNKTMAAIAAEKKRILLTHATGTGKTFIAFQIAWKLFHTRWNLRRDGSRRPRILFLADRNILADQAYNAFSAFPEDALVRIKPSEIKKKGHVPTNGSIFFTIFQTFMSGPDDSPHFGEYPADYFDFIVVDECHRGGANDEGNWRGILEYFSPAVQLGLTATPKRDQNVDTYKYFGDPVHVYSLKEGINDGFLTPFKVKRIQTTLDDYIYSADDQVIQGEPEEGKLYTESDFNRIIEIKARETKRVKILLNEMNQKEKTIIFCATQIHAAAIRDLINQLKDSNDPNYCVRVTANDGEIGERFLREFQDNENTIPTILTTSYKLSTGVDARNIRNIVLMRPINSMIEFKQIIGRGTRLFEGKEYFTIYDFVNAYYHFADPDWDGEPIEPEPPGSPRTNGGGKTEKIDPPTLRPEKVKIKLSDGKERQIQHMIQTSFWNDDGKPISPSEFLENLYGDLPEFFTNEEELRQIWSNPQTRKVFLQQLSEAGYGKDELTILQNLINADNSDLFDVLEYVAFAIEPIARETRVDIAADKIYELLNEQEKGFIEFVLSKYIETGVGELGEDKLPELLKLKYQALADAQSLLGNVDTIRSMFINFQKHLYEPQIST
jgi:type I restriction enzyme, R subunit